MKITLVSCLPYLLLFTETDSGNKFLAFSITLLWCRKESEKAPVLLARMVPIFSKNKGSWSLHPLAKLLIDNFGYRSDVLLEIDRNLGTFSWSGSVIPYYEKQINIMEQILNHTNYNVHKWANKNIKSLRKEIASEKKREEEQDLGIF